MNIWGVSWLASWLGWSSGVTAGTVRIFDKPAATVSMGEMHGLRVSDRAAAIVEIATHTPISIHDRTEV